MNYKTLQIRNLRQIDRFFNKLVPYIVDHKYANFDKRTSLLRYLYITNPYCFYSTGPQISGACAIKHYGFIIHINFTDFVIS